MGKTEMKDITFKSIELLEDGWLKIEGYVFDDTLSEISGESVLTDFIIAVENSHFFTKVKLVSSVRGDVFEVQHSVYVISCKVISRNGIK